MFGGVFAQSDDISHTSHLLIHSCPNLDFSAPETYANRGAYSTRRALCSPANKRSEAALFPLLTRLLFCAPSQSINEKQQNESEAHFYDGLIFTVIIASSEN